MGFCIALAIRQSAPGVLQPTHAAVAGSSGSAGRRFGASKLRLRDFEAKIVIANSPKLWFMVDIFMCIYIYIYHIYVYINI